MIKLKLMMATILMVFAFSLQSNAQKGLTIGVNAMPTNTWMLNSDDSDDSNYEYLPTFGVAYGVSLGYNLNDNIGLELNPMFSHQGQKAESFGTEFSQRNSYLKVPLLLTLNSSPLNTFMFVAKVGPQVEFLAGSELRDSDGEVILDDTKDSFNSTNVGAVLSLGTAINLTDFLQLTASFRFDGTFNNVENEDATFYPADRANTFNVTGDPS